MNIQLRNILLIIGFVLLSCKNQPQVDRVLVSGRQLLVNEKQYVIKGICYHPVPKGSTRRSFETLDQDIELMLEAGINTIRVYAPIDDKNVLDKLDHSGIKVIIGFGYNDKKEKYDIVSQTYLDYVEQYKDHNAILMWELGNEYNYHPEWFKGDIKNWYADMNIAAKAIHEIDKNHPVTTAHGDLPDALALSMGTEIDVWGMNVYRWDKPETIFDEWQKVSDKPMYLSEAGADSFMKIADEGYTQGENQQAQADANGNIIDAVFENTEICSGVAMFSFTDGWWKAGNPDVQDEGGTAPNSTGVPYDGSPNEEYWGIVDIDRNKKMTFEVLKQKYNAVKH